MKSLFSQSLLLTALVCTAASLYAVREYEHERHYRPEREERENCSSCVSWLWENVGFEVKGGVAPIVWVDRGNALCTPDCVNNTATEVNQFLHLFKVPWTVGAELQWSMGDCSRTYLDFQYRQAKGKDACLNVPVLYLPGFVNVTARFDKYQTYSLYLGGDRFFFNDWLCENLSAFAGIEVGFTHERNLNVNLFATDESGYTSSNCYKKRNVLSGGGRFGVDYNNVCNCLTVNLTVEILGQAGPRFGSLEVPTSSLGTVVLLNGVTTEVIFPITLGLRYSF